MREMMRDMMSVFLKGALGEDWNTVYITVFHAEK